MALRKLDKVTIWRYEGLDRFGDSVYATDPETVDARWADYEGAHVDNNGQDFTAMGVIYDDANSFKVNDRVIDKPEAEASIDESFIIRSIKRSRNGSGTRVLYACYFTKNR